MSIDYSEKIPNNVNLAEDKALQRALEHWQPNYLSWWREMGPDGAQDFDVYLRTAVSVEAGGWAHFDHVKMPDYRWGIFLNPAEKDRKIHFGDHLGEAAWQDVPGEHRANLRRIIVTQGDTEPASVEQQRHLGLTCPSQYDLRNLFHRHSRRTHCASQRLNDAYGGTDLSYRLLLRDPNRLEDLVRELKTVAGISRVTSLQAEDESEV